MLAVVTRRITPAWAIVAETSTTEEPNMTEWATVVIGAGHAGLSVSHHLAAGGIGHVVFERGRVGESWRSQRWESFRLNTPGWMNDLPGAAVNTCRDAFPSAAEFASVLALYARRLPVEEQIAVTALRHEHDHYRVETTAGGTTARTVVVASGAQNVPRMPALAGAMPAGVEQLSRGGLSPPG
jgi:putative flavoprotein involved in K+ transport